MKHVTTLLCLGLLAMAGPALGDQIFSQDFSSSTTVSDYAVGGSASGSLFTAIGVTGGASGSITNDNFQVTRTATGDAGGFWVQDLQATPPSLMTIQMTLSVTCDDWQNWAGRVQVGNYSDSDGPNWATSSSNDFMTLGISFRGASYRLDVPNGPTTADFASGSEHTVTIYMNKSGSSAAYTAVDGSSYTLNDNSITYFVDDVLLHENLLTTKTWQVLADLRCVVNGGDAGGTTNDNIIGQVDVYDSLSVVPEPTSMALMGAGGLLLAIRRRRR